MITESQARAIIRYYTAQYTENEPANITWLEQEQAVEALTMQLSWYVGRQLTACHVMDALTTLDELDSLEHGTHPDLVESRDGTISNVLELLGRVESRYHDEVSEILTLAGWSSKVAALGWAA